MQLVAWEVVGQPEASFGIAANTIPCSVILTVNGVAFIPRCHKRRRKWSRIRHSEENIFVETLIYGV
jgi:aspartyl/asparaginyl beta-hydroxylase (cupin superfamily)